MLRMYHNPSVYVCHLLWRDLRMLVRALRHDIQEYLRIYEAGWLYSHRSY